MKVAIRVDASLNMGTGHVMRCLTLAEALKKQGTDVVFICREHDGHLLERIAQQGFKTHTLPKRRNVEAVSNELQGDNELYGQCWLGSTKQQDAELCRPLLEELNPDWLIVDHYGVDQTWQAELAPYYGKLMVIDDLANREHRCDLLLDQTYGRKKEDYAGLVPQQAQLLLGSQYALLRPEFAEWRDYSLKRRANPELKKLLVTMGGVDSDNITGDVLAALNASTLLERIEIIVVMGGTAPHLKSVKQQVRLMSNNTCVKVNIDNMAELMAEADMAIGAAGATTWERCCLGLPSLMIMLADNQKEIASSLSKSMISLAIDKENMKAGIEMLGSISMLRLVDLSNNSANLLDGEGANRVARTILS